MYFKLFVIAIILKCLVLASYAEASHQNQTKYRIWKKPTIEERQNELSTDNSSATVSNLEISVNSYESLETISTGITLALDNSTEISPSETENSVTVTEVSSQETINETESSFNSTENLTEVTLTEIVTSVNTSESLTEVTPIETDTSVNVTESLTVTPIQTEASENVTESLTEGTPIENETSVNVTESLTATPIQTETSVNTTENLSEATPAENENSTITTPSPTEEATIPNNGNENTSDISIPSETFPAETSETAAPSESTLISNTSTTPTPTETTSQEPETTTIDPKYRNETLELYLEEFMKNNPLARMYKSDGFPTPYGSNLNINFTDTLPNCTGIDVVIHFIDLNPFEQDSLYIRGGDENATNEVGTQFTGRQFNYSFMIIHTTTIFIWFKTGEYTGEYQGFVLTYSPFGDDTPPPTTTEAPVTIPPSELQTYELLLVLPKENRTHETWQNLKDVLSYSATKYVTEFKIHVQQPLPENVTFNIFKCPDNWPNYETCVRFVFSIALWDQKYNPEVNFDISIFNYELNSTSLSAMWDLYGRDDFLYVLGIEEYAPPDGTYILLLWTGISLSIIVIFIGVLYSIWRIDIFREYRRMHGKSDDHIDILKDSSEIDISMYPIPHQPYPTLFETNEMNSAGYYDSNEMNVFQNAAYQEKPTTPNLLRHVTNAFSPNIIDFNESQFFPDDEEDFGRVVSLSPRTKQKLLVLGAKRDESIT